MIKLKKIYKTYKTSKDIVVPALSEVDISFSSTGMVFILGKSGSGKSTLLNIIGGLDKYDSGEIFIKGKSTKNFKQSDFDSYRNTSIGFIFQEYNLLEDLTVYENIKLAIDLQGKKNNEDYINEILRDVELEGYGNRQINELSGGQKQRIAIARALVKNPEVIMADEPTGALDSETGKQVLTILQKLSKTRLVIVVSHEREFAEKYASRIIELKDGFIINDVTKNNNTKKFEQTILIVTEQIDEEYIPIKSKLPFKPALKIAVSSLKHRRLRLIFSIILASISFALFGITDSMASYQQDVSAINSMINADVGYAAFTKSEKVYEDDSSEFTMIEKKFSDEEIDEFNKLSNKLQFIPIINEVENTSLLISDYFENKTLYKKGAFYYRGDLSGLSSITPETLDLYNYELIGSLADNDNQIVITKFQYDNFKELGLLQVDEFGNEKPIKFTDEEDFLRQSPHIEFGKYDFEIVGIINTNFNTTRYLDLKNESNTYNSYRAILESEYNQLIKYTIHNVMFLNNDTFYKLIDSGNSRLKTQEYFTIGTAIFKQSIIFFNSYDKLDFNSVNFINNNTLKNLSNNKVILKLSNNPQFDLIDLLPEEHYYNYNVDYLSYVLENNDKPEAEIEFDFFIKFVNDNNIRLETNILSINRFSGESSNTDYEIAGIIRNDDVTNELYFDYENSLYFNSDEYDKFFVEKDLIYNYIFSVIPNDKSLITKLINYHYDESAPNYLIHNEVVVTIDNANETITLLAQISLYVGIGFLIFAAALLFNFISLSVEFKKQEIGILRALGASKKDVIKIFFTEATIIALINFIVAVILSFISVVTINNYLKTEYGLIISIISFGIRQLFIMLLISLIIAYLSSSVPVRRIANKSPVDAIKDK